MNVNLPQRYADEAFQTDILPGRTRLTQKNLARSTSFPSTSKSKPGSSSAALSQASTVKSIETARAERFAENALQKATSMIDFIIEEQQATELDRQNSSSGRPGRAVPRQVVRSARKGKGRAYTD